MASCALESAAATAARVDVTADEAAIRQADAQWVKAAQSGNVDAWLAFYTESAVIFPPNDKVASGREAARKSIGDLLALPVLAISWKPTQVKVARSGDFAYLIGAYVVSWKCSAVTWNSDLPAGN